MTLAETQVDQNFEAFLVALPRLLQSHPGKFALLHRGDVHNFYDTALQAVIEGSKLFGINEFSVQEITERAEDLGFYSYAGSTICA